MTSVHEYLKKNLPKLNESHVMEQAKLICHSIQEAKTKYGQNHIILYEGLYPSIFQYLKEHVYQIEFQKERTLISWPETEKSLHFLINEAKQFGLNNCTLRRIISNEEAVLLEELNYFIEIRVFNNYGSLVWSGTYIEYLKMKDQISETHSFLAILFDMEKRIKKYFRKKMSRRKREATKQLEKKVIKCVSEIKELFELWLEESKSLTTEDLDLLSALSGNQIQTWLLKLFKEHLCSSIMDDQQYCACPFYWDGRTLEFCLDDKDRQTEWSSMVIRLGQALLESEDFHQPLIVFPIIMQTTTSKIGHANVLIIDLKEQTIERYDPIGYENIASWRSDDLDSQLQTFFKAVPIINQFEFKPLSLSCPNIGTLYNGKYVFKGPQSMERTLSYRKKEPKGFCSSWSLLFIYLKLRFPMINQEILVQCSSQFSPKELRTIIRYWNILIVKDLMPPK